MDELHLSHHFARSFRDDFDQLKQIIFNCIHQHIPCIFMTATCSNEIIAASQHLFGFNLTHTDWPSVKDMANRKQSFVTTYTAVGIGYIYNVINNHVGKDECDAQGHPLPDKMMYYGNLRSSVKGLASKIENHLDSTNNLSKYDVLVIHGHQSKEEKSAYLKHFTTCDGNNMNIKMH